MFSPSARERLSLRKTTTSVPKPLEMKALDFGVSSSEPQKDWSSASEILVLSMSRAKAIL